MIKVALQHYLVDFGLSVLFDRISRNFIDSMLNPVITIHNKDLIFTISRIYNDGKSIKRIQFTIIDFPPDMNPELFVSDMLSINVFSYFCSEFFIKQLIEGKYGFTCDVNIEVDTI
jgi:hypothetical protein